MQGWISCRLHTCDEKRGMCTSMARRTTRGDLYYNGYLLRDFLLDLTHVMQLLESSAMRGERNGVIIKKLKRGYSPARRRLYLLRGKL